MSSGLETNKIVGAILTALLVTVGISHFGAALFGSGGHGEHVLAYPVAGGEDTGPVEPEAPEIVPTVLPLLADASAADGEALFAACRACHTPNEGGNDGVGPNLWGVVGADIAANPDFAYSDALSALDGTWSYDALNGFIHNPREYVAGTRMTYPGMPGLEDRANLFAYLRTLSSDPLPLPSQDEIDAAVSAQEAAMGGGEAGEDGEAGEAATDEAGGDAAPAETPDESANPEETDGGETDAGETDAEETDAEETDAGNGAAAPEGQDSAEPESDGQGG